VGLKDNFGVVWEAYDERFAGFYEGFHVGGWVAYEGSHGGVSEVYGSDLDGDGSGVVDVHAAEVGHSLVKF